MDRGGLLSAAFIMHSSLNIREKYSDQYWDAAWNDCLFLGFTIEWKKKDGSAECLIAEQRKEGERERE